MNQDPDTIPVAPALTTMSGAARALRVAHIALVTYETRAGSIESLATVIEVEPGQMPIVEDLVELAHAVRIVRATTLPASRLLDIEPRDRICFQRAFLTWRKWASAKARGKRVEDLVPWEDFDPALIDEDMRRWLAPGVRFAGD